METAKASIALLDQLRRDAMIHLPFLRSASCLIIKPCVTPLLKGVEYRKRLFASTEGELIRSVIDL